MNHQRLALLNPDEVEVVIRLADEAEVDECGVSSSANKIRGGFGMPLITVVVEF